MDCFYAAVEMRDNPKLKNVPMAIGGPSKTKGVLCTSNYKAREFGVRAAMPTFKAFQLCPSLILVRPNFAKYEAASKIVRDIFYEYTDKVQMISLDEAFLDVTDSKHFEGSASLMANEIRKKIYERTGLTASAGISYNKMLAKIASDWNKPNGQYCVTPDSAQDFLKDLPLKKISGIGKVSATNLERIGLRTCSDVLKYDLHELIIKIGKRYAIDLYESCLGIDNSEVINRRQRKSFSIERTFFSETTKSMALDYIDDLIEEFGERFKEIDQFHIHNRTISHLVIKIRYSDFESHTKELMLDSIHAKKILDHLCLDDQAISMIRNAIESFINSSPKGIRLMGTGIKLKDRESVQIPLPLSEIA